MSIALTNKVIHKVATEQFKVKDPIRYIFIRFMHKRFSDERFESYVLEWAARFKSENPRVYMDSLSLKLYEEILKN